MIETDISNCWNAIDFHSLMEMESRLADAHAKLAAGTGHGNDLLGWYRLPHGTEDQTTDRIRRTALKIRANSKALVVIADAPVLAGIRAAVEYMQGSLYNEKAEVRLYYAGDHLSSRALNDIADHLRGIDFSVNIIARSGDDIETAVAARTFRWLLNRRYGPEQARERVYLTTDSNRGKLHVMAVEEGLTTLEMPGGIAQGFSVLSACGLLPMAVAGLDIRALMAGARQEERELDERSMDNPAWQYAGVRTLLYESGRHTELLAGYEPQLRAFGCWWQQLMNGSTGWEGSGLLTVPVLMPSDAYLMSGMLSASGSSGLFETLLAFQPDSKSLSIELDWKNLDDMNCLSGVSISSIMDTACEAMLEHQTDAGLPVMNIRCSRMDATTLGQLFYFFELVAALSGYLLDVNPFFSGEREFVTQTVRRVLQK